MCGVGTASNCVYSPDGKGTQCHTNEDGHLGFRYVCMYVCMYIFMRVSLWCLSKLIYLAQKLIFNIIITFMNVLHKGQIYDFNFTFIM